MLSDVLLINDDFKKLAKELFEYIEPIRNCNRWVIAIAGESGSGKSVLTHCLSMCYKSAGLKAKPLHTDNYYKTLPDERTEWRKKNGPLAIGSDEYDWDVLNNNIKSFRNAAVAVDMPCVELLTNTVDRLTTDFANIDVLIVEGLYAMRVDDADLRIFIDIPYYKSLKAQTMRGKETLDDFREIVLKREHEEVLVTKALSDVVVGLRDNEATSLRDNETTRFWLRCKV